MFKKLIFGVVNICKKADNGSEKYCAALYGILFGALILFEGIFLLIFSQFKKPSEDVALYSTVTIFCALLIFYLYITIKYKDS